MTPTPTDTTGAAPVEVCFNPFLIFDIRDGRPASARIDWSDTCQGTAGASPSGWDLDYDSDTPTAKAACAVVDDDDFRADVQAAIDRAIARHA